LNGLRCQGTAEEHSQSGGPYFQQDGVKGFWFMVLEKMVEILAMIKS
jgi:hypothetical protein